MKKGILGLIALGFALSGCQTAPVTDDRLVASEFAETLANPENGVVSELSANLSLAGGSDFNSNQTSGGCGGAVVITLSNVLGPGFAWDAATNGYVKTGSNVTVSSGNWTGVIAAYGVLIRFYPSWDGSGTPVALTNPKNLASNTNIHSVRYGRIYSGVITNTVRNIIRAVNVTTELLVTALNDGTNGAKVSGNRTETVSASGALWTGNWTLTAAFADVNAYRDYFDDGWVTTYQGTADLVFNGTWTGPRGTKTVNTTATVTFNRQRTVAISADGNVVVVDIRTGSQQ